MRELQVMVDDVLEAQLEALWQRHGPWAILKALIGSALRRSQPWNSNRIDELNNYMRRDIGAPEKGDLDEDRSLHLRRLL